MKRLIYTSVISIVIALTSGCTSSKNLVVNVQKPAQLMLPAYINNIIIVDNLVPQPDDAGHTLISYTKDGREIEQNIKVNSDSVGIILTDALYRKLDELNYLANTSLYNTAVRKDIDYLEVKPMDADNIREICKLVNADALLSVNRFLTTTENYTVPYEYQASAQNLRLNLSSEFQIYSANGDLISPSLTVNDSIFWSEFYEGNRRISPDSLPEREAAIKEAAEYTGQKIAQSIVPYWTEEVRSYYGEEKNAVKQADQGNWAEALSIWQEAFNNETKNLKRKARIASNIALANELLDNLPEAVIAITEAQQLFQQSAVTSLDLQQANAAEEYKKELLQRFNDFKLLDMRKDSAPQ